MTRLSVRALVNNRGLDASQGIRSAMISEQTTVLRTWLTDHRQQSEIWWGAQDAVPLITNGGPGEKLTMVVVADGWAQEDQADWSATVDRLLTDPVTGVFAQDFFAERRSDFNLVRIDLTSAQSGIGTKAYQLNAAGTEWVLQSQVDRDTALGLYYNGQNSLNLVWMESTPEGAPTVGSETRLAQALSIWAPDYDLVFVLANSRRPDGTPNFGGVAGAGRFSAPQGIDWPVVAHELGHSLGLLADEYFQTTPTGCGSTAYSGGEPGSVNITANTDRATLKWGHHVAASTPVPTGTGGCATYNAGPRPATWDDTDSVGLFEGAGGPNVATGLYRPVINCRMNSNAAEFCPVCREAMIGAVNNGISDRSSAAEGYLRVVVRRRGDGLVVTSARRIAGRLRRPRVLAPGLGYEIELDGRRLVLASLAELGETRALEPNGQHRSLPGVVEEFVVRVPAPELRGADLSRLAVRLVRVQAPTQREQARPRPPQPSVTRVLASTSIRSGADLPAAFREAAQG